MTDRPDITLKLLDQRLKFLGHFLETAHKLAALGLYAPDASQRAQLDAALDELVKTVEFLHESGVFDELAKLRFQDVQTYLDLVGDSAHALRGIDLATGRGTIAY